jgi:hypothetical protein
MTEENGGNKGRVPMVLESLPLQATYYSSVLFVSKSKSRDRKYAELKLVLEMLPLQYFDPLPIIVYMRIAGLGLFPTSCEVYRFS